MTRFMAQSVQQKSRPSPNRGHPHHSQDKRKKENEKERVLLKSPTFDALCIGRPDRTEYAADKEEKAARMDGWMYGLDD